MIVDVIGRDAGVEMMFEKLGHRVYTLENPFEWYREDEKNSPDVVVFTGGSDVTPILYNEENTASGCNSQRDMKEMVFFHRFHKHPKLGICRGGQFLNVMSGGRMIQDYPGHAIADTHEAVDRKRNTRIQVTSTHHQIMVGSPSSVNYMYAVNPDGINTAECIWYGNTNSLCFQPHPEYLEADRKKNPMLGFLQHVFADNFGLAL